MGKRCETFEHTADVGLLAEADTLGELYEALAEGLADLVCARESVRPAELRRLTVESDDEATLAVDFLTKVLGLLQTDRFCVGEVRAVSACPTRVEAELRGERYDPSRHELGGEIKAVTYHMLEVRQDGGTWRGRVVLDL